jgi:hypothetical protein
MVHYEYGDWIVQAHVNVEIHYCLKSATTVSLRYQLKIGYAV